MTHSTYLVPHPTHRPKSRGFRHGGELNSSLENRFADQIPIQRKIMHVSRMTIENFRNFENIDLTELPPVHVVVGENRQVQLVAWPPAGLDSRRTLHDSPIRIDRGHLSTMMAVPWTTSSWSTEDSA
jgi:hypothetical protein